MGAAIEDYELIRMLGSENVFEARHHATGRSAAIKVVPPAVDRAARLARMRTLAAVDHPNVARFIELGDLIDGGAFAVMELLDGPTLEAWLGSAVLPTAHVVSMGILMARGVAGAHAYGVVHGRLEPSHLMMVAAPTGRSTVKLIGFALGAHAHSRTDAAYRSPEVRDEQPPDERSDIFSLGAILRRAHARDESDPIACELDSIIARCIAPDPRHRLQTAAEVHAALDVLRTPRRRKAPTPSGRPSRPPTPITEQIDVRAALGLDAPPSGGDA